ncbi:MAG: DUF4145 domain-containing protein [Sedimentisphaerales bacterium]|jgi:hypothetical protein
MRKFLIRNLWWITAVLALLLLIIHGLPGQKIVIDNTSVVLFIIILFSPFLSAIRKIKFGDFEAEIDPKEVEKIRSDVDTQLDESETPDTAPVQGIETTVKQIQTLGETDPVIALAKLRIEIEKVVVKLHKKTQSNQQQRRPLSIGKMVHDLTTQEILPQGFSGPVREVISICNRAVHGEEIREQDAKAMIAVGASLLQRLFWFSREYLLNPTESSTITQTEVDEYNKSRYRLVTIIPYVDNPVRNIRVMDQEELDDFLEGYQEYAEFIVELTRIA